MIKKDSHPDYDGFAYIPGDFTASLVYYLELEATYEADIAAGKTGLFGIKNRNYNLVTRNCTMETMNGLMLGVLTDGTSVGSYYGELYSIGIQPNANLHGLQMAFMNSAYTYSGFTTQVSANLQNAQSYLSNMYGDYSDPTGKYGNTQVIAMQKIINKMSALTQ